ncbi:X2-like carbohydrate binding domain-containing protein [Paenibacillus agaridevorans]|uniref:RCC1 domain-containing protein n=1 Tax=Paenibacillus agaridevorans TaxID=171404 RepID=UPI001BE4BFE6|nr:X2-like carbohydrate binding domain-containing protein [Paenibacillus agaridevorans]
MEISSSKSPARHGKWQMAWSKLLVAAMMIGLLQPFAAPSRVAHADAGDAASGNRIAISMGSNSNGQLGRRTVKDEANFSDIQSPDGINVLSELHVKAIEAGEKFSLALTEEGDVYYFGNRPGQFLDSDHITVPSKLDGLPPIQKISASYKHALLLTEDGSVYAFGNNVWGELGLGHAHSVSTPTLVPNLSDIAEISAGYSFSFALTNTGQVYAFGNNYNGQLGLGGSGDYLYTAQIIPYFSNVKAISAGTDHSLALLDNGEVYAFGRNGVGQLGLDSFTDFNTPQKVTAPAGEPSGWGVAVEAGNNASFVVASSGKVYAFGMATPTGHLGLYNPSQSYTPYKTPTALTLENVSAVSTGNEHTLFLTTDGKVYGTGSSSYWGTYQGATLREPKEVLSGISDITHISAGYKHSLVIGKIGGKLGQQTASFNVFRPENETDLAIDVKRNGNALVSVEDENGQLTAGEDYEIVDNQFYLLKSYLTGLEVGEYELTFRFSSGAPQSLELSIYNKSLSFVLTPGFVFDQNPSLLAEQNTDIELELNGNTLSGIKLAYLIGNSPSSIDLLAGSDYTIDGNNVTISDSYLAYYSTWNKSSFSLVFTFSDNTVISIPAHIFRSNNSTLAQSNYYNLIESILVERDGQFQGNTEIIVNLYGNQFLGIRNGMTTLSEGVDYWTASPDSGKQLVTISSDYLLSLTGEQAELTFQMDKGVPPKLTVHLLDSVYGEDGLYAFGENYYFQLGLGDDEDRLLPSYMEVLRGKPIREADGGYFYSMAVTTEGDVYAFSAIFPELGDAEEPIVVFNNLPEIASLSAGQEHALLLSESGDVYGWGLNNYGQLGSEPSSEQEFYVLGPVKVEGLSGIKAVAAGGAHSLALTEDGKVYVFGRNQFGQLGFEGPAAPGAPDYLTEPVMLKDIPEIAAIAAGPGHSLLLTADGRVLSFGSGQNGELGLGDSDNVFVPTFVDTDNYTITAIAAGGDYEYYENAEEEYSYAYGRSFLATSDGKVLAFGNGSSDRLGLGEDIDDDIYEPTLIETDMPPIKKIIAGGQHTLLLAENGDVYGFGLNYEGQLGLNDTAIRYIPTKLERLSGAKGVAAGFMHSLAWFRTDNSELNPGSAAFDRNVNKQQPIEITLTLNCNSLEVISLGEVVLEEGADYQLQGNKVVLETAYLSKLAVGSHSLTFSFSDGEPQILTVAVTDSTPAGGGNGGGGGGNNGGTGNGTGGGQGSNEQGNDGTNSNGEEDGDGDNDNSGEGSHGSGGGQTVPTNKPSDTAGHWAESLIDQAIAKGLVKGYPDGTYKPDRGMSRAEFAVMLASALKLEPASSTHSFADSAAIGLWAVDAVNHVVASGLIGGYPDGSFKPGKGLTRAELAVIIARALHLKDDREAASKFTDADILPSWAVGAIGALSEEDILLGRNDGRFDANGIATRAEAVTILLRVINIIK